MWAAARLSALPQRRKVLITISDGAPVDEFDASTEGLAYLSDHLRTVVDEIVQAGEIKLAAIAIGYQPDIAYPVSSYVDAPDDLGQALITLLERLVTDQR